MFWPPKFLFFLLIFTGYWVVFWQQYTSLPGYLHTYVDPDADVELVLVTDGSPAPHGAVVICCTVLMNLLTRKIPAFRAVIIGTIITSLGWVILALHPTVWGAVFSLICVATGEITQAPRYYEYIAKLAPANQQGTYMGFAFLPIGIGSLIGGWFGGRMMHQFGEVRRQPGYAWLAIVAVGLLTAFLLVLCDRIVKPESSSAA